MTMRLVGFGQTVRQATIRLDESAALRRWLSRLALGIGVLWMVGLGMQRGIRTGGDTGDYLLRVERLRAQGVSFLYQEQMLPVHATTLWMSWLGPVGFVALSVVLTAFLPWLVLTILRHCGVGSLGCLGALLYVGTNPELYQWAWFILTDGFFLIQVVLLLAMLTKPTYPRAWWVLLPLVVYNVLYTRPTGIFVIPGLLVFALLTTEPLKRHFLLTLAVTAALWSGGWMLASGGTSGKHAGITRHAFIHGHLLQDPRMSEPLAVPFSPEQAEGKSIVQLCAAYPAYCLEYSARKWFTYFLPVFPKYSLRHKVFNALYFGSLLILSVASLGVAVLRLRPGLRRSVQQGTDRRLRAAILCGVIMGTAGVFHTATHIDSDARFLMVWTPVWICGTFLLLSAAIEPMARAQPEAIG